VPSLVVLAAILLAGALFTRFTFLFLACYLIVALIALAKVWVWRMRKGLRVERRYVPRVFLGESATVTLHLSNRSLLPIPWVSVREALPPKLATHDALRRVVALGPRSSVDVTYALPGSRRGFHRCGPLTARYGDVFGLFGETLLIDRPDFLIVYPQIVPLGGFNQPSYSPYGVMRSSQIVYQDPARIIGVRDYQPGDSQRLINWKASAAAGHLLVRKLEPAVSHEVSIFVDLNPASYSRQWRDAASELAVVVAASLATHLLENKQTVGLTVNGLDPEYLGGARVGLTADVKRLVGARYPRIALGRGRGHLMAILDVLARVELLEVGAAADVVTAGAVGLAWGASLIVVTGQRSPALLAALVAQRKLGHQVTVVFTDPSAATLAEGAARAAGLTAFAITGKEKMDVWRVGRATA